MYWSNLYPAFIFESIYLTISFVIFCLCFLSFFCISISSYLWDSIIAFDLPLCSILSKKIQTFIRTTRSSHLYVSAYHHTSACFHQPDSNSCQVMQKILHAAVLVENINAAIDRFILFSIHVFSTFCKINLKFVFNAEPTTNFVHLFVISRTYLNDKSTTKQHIVAYLRHCMFFRHKTPTPLLTTVKASSNYDVLQ